MFEVAVAKHPAVSVPVTVYIVFTVGKARTVSPVVKFNPVAGDHVYVAAPEAERRRAEAFPLQIAALVGETVTVGFGSN